jgi:hypothetical protein
LSLFQVVLLSRLESMTLGSLPKRTLAMIWVEYRLVSRVLEHSEEHEVLQQFHKRY